MTNPTRTSDTRNERVKGQLTSNCEMSFHPPNLITPSGNTTCQTLEAQKNHPLETQKNHTLETQKNHTLESGLWLSQKRMIDPSHADIRLDTRVDVNSDV